jgi:hypothetical protein
MVIPIPYAVSYQTTVRGSVPKLVRCEQCGHEYVYLLTVSSWGRATSFLFLDNEGARECSALRAEAVLRSELRHGCAVVPCPSCGRIQEHMVPQAPRLYRRWMKKAALAAFFVGGVLFVPTMVVTTTGNFRGSSRGPALDHSRHVGGQRCRLPLSSTRVIAAL